MMKKISTKDLKQGMVLATPIIVDDHTLLDQGVILSEKYIDSILKRNIPAVQIEETFDLSFKLENFFTPRYLPVPPAAELFSRPAVRRLGTVLQEQCATGDFHTIKPVPVTPRPLSFSYQSNLESFANIIDSFRQGTRINEKSVCSIVSEIMFHTACDPVASFGVLNHATPDNYLLSHSLNVTYLSILIGQQLGFNQKTLFNLGISALLHDIGMLLLDSPFWIERRELYALEQLDIQKHTVYGIDAITALSSFPPEVAHVAYTHHERLDGTGYPKGRKSNLIDSFSRIIGLCDVFAAMISDRSWRRKKSLPETLDHLYLKNSHQFSQDHLTALLSFLDRIEPGISDQVLKMQCAYASSFGIVVIDSEPDSWSNLLTSSFTRHHFTTAVIRDFNIELSQEFPLRLTVLIDKTGDPYQSYRTILSTRLKNQPVIVISNPNAEVPGLRKCDLLISEACADIVTILNQIKNQIFH